MRAAVPNRGGIDVEPLNEGSGAHLVEGRHGCDHAGSSQVNDQGHGVYYGPLGH